MEEESKEQIARRHVYMLIEATKRPLTTPKFNEEIEKKLAELLELDM